MANVIHFTEVLLCAACLVIIPCDISLCLTCRHCFTGKCISHMQTLKRASLSHAILFISATVARNTEFFVQQYLIVEYLENSIFYFDTL